MWARQLGQLAGVDGAAARLRALLHRHRPAARGDAGSAGAARHRRLHLRARGGRRPPDGRLRAGGQAVGHGGHPPRLRLLAAPRGLGSLPGPDGAGPGANPRARLGAGAPARQRPRELHARRALPARRGPRVPELLRRPPASTPSASPRPPAPARCWRSGSWAASRRWTCGTSTSAAWRPFQANPRYLRDRTVEMVGVLYAMHWPFRQPETARGVRRQRAPRPPGRARRLLRRRHGLGARRTGTPRRAWSRPIATASAARTGSRARRAEHRAVREAVGLFDQSSFAKFRLEGPDATAVLQRLCANDVDVPPGRIVYTAMLNRRGGIECDLTVTRARRGRVPHRHRGCRLDPRRRLDPPAPRRRARGAHRRDVGARRRRRHGPALARRSSRASPTPT